MRNAFVETLTELAARDRDVVLITGDLGFGIFEEFSERFPDQFINAGVAEQNMTMLAAGMALEGKKLFTYSIGNFPTLRCLEQIRNDICYHDANVTIIGMGGGFSYGQLGMSHHATEDLSIMRSLPNMVVLAPSSEFEVKSATHALYRLGGPAYMRLDKSKVEETAISPSFDLGKAKLVRDGNDLTFVAAGAILHEAMVAADALSQDGIECRVLSMHTLKPLDKAALDRAAIETGCVITVEENTVIAGLGGAVAEHYMECSNRPKKFKRIGLEDTYSSVVGDQFFLRQYYQMDADYLQKIAREMTIECRNEASI